MKEVNKLVIEFRNLLIVTNNPTDRITLKDMYGVFYKWSIEEMDEESPTGKTTFKNQIELPIVQLGSNKIGYRGIKFNDDLEWYLPE